MILFMVLGYDFLQGEMPSGLWVQFLPLYGFAGFGLLTILYVKVIKKRNLSDIMLYMNRKGITDFLKSFLIGLLLVVMTLSALLLTDYYTFHGFGKLDGSIFVMGFLAYLIQGSVEEVMCRGFLLNSLSRKVCKIGAICISTILFIIPHISSIRQMEGILAVIAMINLVLVSLLFSLAMIKGNSVASAMVFTLAGTLY